MSPVNKSALSVPNILTAETDNVSCLEAVDARGEFNIVLYEYRLTGCESKNESLMRTPLRVVRQNSRHHALTLDRYIARLLLERTRHRGVRLRNAATRARDADAHRKYYQRRRYETVSV